MVPGDDERDKPDDDLPTETVPQDELDAIMAKVAATDEDLPTERASAAQIQDIVDAARDEIPTVSVRRSEVPAPHADHEPTLTEDDDDEPTLTEDDDDEPTLTEDDDVPVHPEDLDELPTEILARPLPPPPTVSARPVPVDPPAGAIQLPLAPDELEETRTIAIDEDEAAAHDPDFDETLEQRAAVLKPAPATAAAPFVRHPAGDTARVPRQGGRGVLVGAIAVLAIGGLAGGWYYLRRGDGAAPSTSTKPAPADAAAAAVDAPVAEPSAADAGPVPGEPFTASLARSQPAIDSCISAHADDVGDGVTVTFVLPIGTDGTAPGASVRPARIARTGLGTCLRDVARSTRFAEQGKPVSVSIPLTVKAH